MVTSDSLTLSQPAKAANPSLATVAKLVNAPDLGSGVPQDLRVRFPPVASEGTREEKVGGTMPDHKRKPGKPEERLKIEGDWEAALKKALRKPAQRRAPKKRAKGKGRSGGK